MLSLGTPNEKLHKRMTKVTGLARAASTSRLAQQTNISTAPVVVASGNGSDQFACLPKSCSSFNELFPLDIARYQNQYGMQPCPLVIAGPSGSGKSTLLKRLMEEFQDCFGFSVSRKFISASYSVITLIHKFSVSGTDTTRNPRSGEEHGKEYFFVPHHEFEYCIQNEDFIEFTRFSNNYYGTSKKAVLDVLSSGKICILDVEMDGVKNLKKTHLNPRFVFIKPPSMEVLVSLALSHCFSFFILS